MSSGSESGPNAAKGKVLCTYVIETGPPVPVGQKEVISTKKTEEWLTKKKTDTLVTKQVETRVKREIVVTDDGEIIEDSGPLVTTDTTEESKTEEQENTERKTCGLDDPGPGWILLPGSEVVSDTKQSNTTSHETREEKTDTEITEEVGGLSREEIVRALKQKELAAIRGRDSPSDITGRILQSAQKHKVVDTEEVNQVSDFKDGRASTQTRKSSHRQEFFDDDDDEPDQVAIAYPLPCIANDRLTPTSTSSRRNGHPDAVRITSPSSFVQRVSSPTSGSERWESAPERLVAGSRQSDSVRVSTCGSPEDTVRRHKTFNWVENHFGSQDLEQSGLTGSAVTPDDPVTSPAGSSRHLHYTKRQQVPRGTSAASPPPQQMPRRSSRPRGPVLADVPKAQYYLGEDPGNGERFTGTLPPSSSDDGRPLARSAKPPSDSASVRFATLGRDVPVHWERDDRGKAHQPSNPGPPSGWNGLKKEKPGMRKSPAEVIVSPSVTDIIHSLRSKAYLERESSAVSIRDDDSVFGFGGGSALYRPARSPTRHPAKRHVIKIAIKSDDSDCSSPVNSPRRVATPTQAQSFEYHRPAAPPSRENGTRRESDGIVRNAINSLLRNRLNSASDKSPGSSASNSLSRRHNRPTNLKSNANLAASSPNVNRVDFEPSPRSSPRSSVLGGSRSQSIGNLSQSATDNGHGGSSTLRNGIRSPYYGTTLTDGVARLDVGGSKTRRDKFMQQFLDDGDDERRRPERAYPTRQRHTPGTTRWSPQACTPLSVSPPSSPPTYTNRIKLPSPVPPSRTSSSPPPSPQSPLPPLTRPFSPPYYYHGPAYNHHVPNGRKVGPKPGYYRAKSSPRSYPSRSPSPPSFARRPPSPVLPKPSSLGDDDSSNASGRSRSTNTGSRSSDVTPPSERVEATTKRRVTTTTTRRREIELPETDYYYESITNGSLPRDKNRAVVRIRD